MGAAMTWERHAREEVRPKIASSAYCIALTPSDADPDPKQALEIGYMVLLNKPIVVVADPLQPIPPGLRRLAHKIIELNAPLGTDSGAQQLMAALAGWEPEALS